MMMNTLLLTTFLKDFTHRASTGALTAADVEQFEQNMTKYHIYVPFCNFTADALVIMYNHYPGMIKKFLFRVIQTPKFEEYFINLMNSVTPEENMELFCYFARSAQFPPNILKGVLNEYEDDRRLEALLCIAEVVACEGLYFFDHVPFCNFLTPATLVSVYNYKPKVIKEFLLRVIHTPKFEDYFMTLLSSVTPQQSWELFCSLTSSAQFPPDLLQKVLSEYDDERRGDALLWITEIMACQGLLFYAD